MKQLGLAIWMYADENREQFPDCTGAVWPWDLPAKAANAFVRNGGNPWFRSGWTSRSILRSEITARLVRPMAIMSSTMATA